MTTVLWKRLDVRGHDACRVGGFHLEGTAVFLSPDGPARLHYEVMCNDAWESQWGRVRGFAGARAIDLFITRNDAAWTLNGAAVAGLESCVDLDYGFTPATNSIALRRLSLAVGESADAPAAWLDDASFTLVFLPQRYTRRMENTYWYESPGRTTRANWR